MLISPTLMIGSMIEMAMSLPSVALGDPFPDTRWHQESRGYRERLFRAEGVKFTRGFVEAYEGTNPVTRALNTLFMTDQSARYTAARKLLKEIDNPAPQEARAFSFPSTKSQ